MHYINELFWTIFLVGFGAAFGYTLRDVLYERMVNQSERDHHPQTPRSDSGD